MEDGLVRAFDTGRILTNHLGAPIHRVYVSPFLRCLQTAAQVVSAVDSTVTGHRDSAAHSQLKVCVKYGLCEKLNYKATPAEVAPRDWNWGFSSTDLQTLLPPDYADHSVEPVYKQMPQFGELPTAIRSRFQEVFQCLADNYHYENIMLITHGIGVGVVVSTCLKYDTRVVQVDCFGYPLRDPFSANLIPSLLEILSCVHSVTQLVSNF